jgi:hypothetical protein
MQLDNECSKVKSKRQIDNTTDAQGRAGDALIEKRSVSCLTTCQLTSGLV